MKGIRRQKSCFAKDQTLKLLSPILLLFLVFTDSVVLFLYFYFIFYNRQKPNNKELKAHHITARTSERKYSKKKNGNELKAHHYSQRVPLKEGLNDLLNDLQDQGWHCQEAEGAESSQIDILL